MQENKVSDKEMIRFQEVTLQNAARIAGISLIIMTILALLSFPFLQNFIEPNNTLKTVNNINDNQSLFRFVICVVLIIIFLDVIIAWALYTLLKPVNKSLALLMALFRVVYAAIFASTLNNLYIVINNLGNIHFHNQVMIFINAFNNGWDIGLAIFGIHILILGYLVFKSDYLPKWIGILVIIASSGYLIDSFGKIISPSYELNIGMFTFIGEVILGIWLILKGGKIPNIKEA